MSLLHVRGYQTPCTGTSMIFEPFQHGDDGTHTGPKPGLGLGSST